MQIIECGQLAYNKALTLQNKLKAWQLSLSADEQSLLDSSSVA